MAGDLRSLVQWGSLIMSSSGLSLRACVSGCAVQPACSAAFFANNFCYLLHGDVTTTPGGPHQGAMRYAPSASPCISTWLVTETDMVTSTGEVVYTMTPSSPPVTPFSTPPSTQSSEESSRGTPSSSTFTVTETRVYTVTSCVATVTDCPTRQQTTYLTTETITYVTTICPETAQATVVQAIGSATTIPHTSVI